MSERKVVVVTGGSRGIGAATARLAAREGWSVCLTYRSAQGEAEGVVADVQAAGGEALAVRADTAQESDIVALFSTVDERFGRIDGLVNNAGILDRPMNVDAIDGAALTHMLAVNIGGCFLCLREAARRMKARGGSIVNIGSRLSELGGAGGFVHYATTKGAIDSLTVGAARELAAEGVRVNCVSPGVIETDIHETTGIAGRAKTLSTQVPMNRPGTAEEVAEAVVWLLSDQASYITGAKLNVSGGR